MKITEDVRKYAAEHGISEETAIEKGLRTEGNGVHEVGIRNLREDVTVAASLCRGVPLSGERTLPACWFRHPAETNFSECLWDNTSFPATNIASLRALGLDLAA